MNKSHILQRIMINDDAGRIQFENNNLTTKFECKIPTKYQINSITLVRPCSIVVVLDKLQFVNLQMQF